MEHYRFDFDAVASIGYVFFDNAGDNFKLLQNAIKHSRYNLNYVAVPNSVSEADLFGDTYKFECGLLACSNATGGHYVQKRRYDRYTGLFSHVQGKRITKFLVAGHVFGFFTHKEKHSEFIVELRFKQKERCYRNTFNQTPVVFRRNWKKFLEHIGYLKFTAYHSDNIDYIQKKREDLEKDLLQRFHILKSYISLDAL
jgi:hypothetical protein